MEKKLCPIHRYYYEGECPLCKQEKLEKLAKRFVENSVYGNYGAKKEDVRVEPSKESLMMLMEKFNTR